MVAGVCGALVVTACVPPPAPGGSGLPNGSPGGAIACSVLPADNIWNTRVDTAPLDPSSATYVATIGASATMHADFGSGLWNGGPIGIPYVVVNSGQPGVERLVQPAPGERPRAVPDPAQRAGRGRCQRRR